MESDHITNGIYTHFQITFYGANMSTEEHGSCNYFIKHLDNQDISTICSVLVRCDRVVASLTPLNRLQTYELVPDRTFVGRNTLHECLDEI